MLRRQLPGGFSFAILIFGLTNFALAQMSLTPATQPAVQSTTQLAKPPAYTILRWDENYSYLKDPANRTDFFDPIKYIPFGDSGDSYLSIGGQVRYRYEYFNNTSFGGGFEDNDGYHLFRFLLHGDLHLNQNFRVFVQGKSSLIEDGGIGAGGAPRLNDADELDLQQAFADLIIPNDAVKFTARVGRQEVIYGVQRVIGASDWGNVKRSYDGVRLMSEAGKNQLDFFWFRPVDIEKEEFNNGEPSISYTGVYDTYSLAGLIKEKDASKLEMYGIVLNRENARFAQNATGASADEDRYTVGGRFSTNPKPFELDLEGTYQFGNFASGNISAWMFSGVFGYTFEDLQMQPRAVIGFDIASGDDNPADADLGTYNQLTPTTHHYFGYADIIGRQNIIDVHPEIDLTLLQNSKYAKKLSFETAYHLFWRENKADALYGTNAGGLAPSGTTGIARAAGGSDEAFVGSELDLILSWQFDRHLSGYVGYSHFFAGDFIHDTAGPGGFDRDIDFAYAALVYTF